LLLTVKVASRHAPASLKGRHNYFWPLTSSFLLYQKLTSLINKEFQ
jgi:hypothetical protein